jgi:hypothetical protein
MSADQERAAVVAWLKERAECFTEPTQRDYDKRDAERDAAVKELVAAAWQVYKDYDGEPEDMIDLRAALAKLERKP